MLNFYFDFYDTYVYTHVHIIYIFFDIFQYLNYFMAAAAQLAQTKNVLMTLTARIVGAGVEGWDYTGLLLRPP